MTGSPPRDALFNPLLETKLFVPRWRAGLVARRRLIERLERGTQGKLTLVSAAAGFGKSTLLAEWVADASERDRRIAWVSLDAADNDAARFWAYVIAALQRACPEVGHTTLALLQSAQPPPIETVLTTLINDVASRNDDLVLILDDYHVIESRSIHTALDFLLDHLPPHTHLVIAGRADPPLSLSRLRARGEATEVRAADLRFTPDEAAAFLNAATGLNLTADDVAALERRTEGWIAGLQLAALSLQGRDDVAGYIRAFAGDHRYILDYLVEEVLGHQPEQIRTFLLQTSMLDRLCGPLCDAVTERDGSQALLIDLERRNLFVVPLDDRRHWFRYHHLFADVLRAYALAEDSGGLQARHLRASQWYERQDLLPEAVQHAIAARDFSRAADLVERMLPQLRRDRVGMTVLGWLTALPDDLLERRPVLNAAYAWGLLSNGQFDDVEARLRAAERSIQDARHECVYVSDEEFRLLPATIAIYRSVLAQLRGDFPTSATQARRVLELAPEDDHLRFGGASALLGLASWWSGDLEVAYEMYDQGMMHLEQAGHLADVINGALVVVDIRLAQGRLREAQRSLDQALQLAMASEEPYPFGTASLYVGMSELQRERNDLRTANQHLLTCQEVARRSGTPYNRSRWCSTMARIKEAEGDLDCALDLLDEAERRYVPDFFPIVRPIAAMRTRVWILQGRLAEALDWAGERHLSSEAELRYVREFEHVTLARLLLAQARMGDDAALDASTDLLERLRQAAETGGRTGSLIEILALQALALQARRDSASALAALERALTLAEPEGYVRVFVDEGPPMAALLDAAVKRGLSANYARSLLAALGAAPEPMPAKSGVSQPLSERERAVLRLLASDLSGPELANELMISLNTLRTHTKNIYSKLGVTSRRAAVRRATDLNLL